MMRTIHPEPFTVYEFSELSEEAQERAIQHVQETDHDRGWFWSQEWRDSLKGAEEEFPIVVGNWEVEIGRGDCPITVDSEIADLAGVRAWKWFQNNGYGDLKDCPWTGYCGDESFLDPLRAFLKKPDYRTLEELFQECGASWAQAWALEMEWQYSDECIREELENGDQEYLENGEVYL